MKIKVQNMRSSNGNDIPNQFIIRTNKHVYFQSYSSIIARRDRNNGEIILDKDKWDYSTTTGKYRNIFLDEKKPGTQYKIDQGIYKLKDLNK